jgi:hypothetical protein
MTPAQALTRSLRGKWHDTYGTAKCPAHEDRSPSLSISDGERRVVVKCHTGCDQRDVLGALRRLRLWPIGGDASPAPASADARRKAALEMWGAARPIAGTIAENYLRGRAISIDLPPTLRYAGALKHHDTGLLLPGMIGVVQSGDRRVIAIHRTFLTESGKKAPLSTPKMALGALGDGAVRLAAAGPELGIAEGIETGLSAMEIFGVPVWATLGGERLRKIALPPDVVHVTIFADNGAPGRALALKAVETYTSRRKVTLRFPPVEFSDWNDVLQARRGAAA